MEFERGSRIAQSRRPGQRARAASIVAFTAVGWCAKSSTINTPPISPLTSIRRLTFRSVRRRMDVKGEIGGVLIVDDFAHHPTAVKATIDAARARWPGRRLWAILEPRSNSMRRKVFQEALPKALALSDRVILGGVFRALQLGDENRLDPETVTASVRALGKDARVFPSSDAIAEY